MTDDEDFFKSEPTLTFYRAAVLSSLQMAKTVVALTEVGYEGCGISP